MKRKKISNIEDVDLKPSQPLTQKATKTKMNKDTSDILEIKKKMSKVNLYLSLLNKQLFETVAITDVDLAAEIENEVNDFLILKAKSVFVTPNSTSDFTPSELAFLKLVSRKGMEVKPEPKEAVEVNNTVPVMVQQSVAKIERKANIDTKPNTVRKKVSVIGEDGKPKEVEIETEKIVLPPPEIRRHMPPSYEQQVARAHADMAVMQRAVNATSGPLVVDSTDD